MFPVECIELKWFDLISKLTYMKLQHGPTLQVSGVSAGDGVNEALLDVTRTACPVDRLNDHFSVFSAMRLNTSDKFQFLTLHHLKLR